MPKVVDHEQMRQDLARRSVALFACEGYAALSVRRLADGLGVSTGTLYHYYPSKSELFEAAIHSVVELDIAEVTAGLVGSTRDPKRRLRALLRFVGNAQDRLASYYRVLTEFAAEGDVTDEWISSLQRARKRYQTALGEVLGIADRGRCDLILLAISGLILRAMSGDQTTSIDGTARTLEALVLTEDP